jgi:hypothetical protein
MWRQMHDLFGNIFKRCNHILSVAEILRWVKGAFLFCVPRQVSLAGGAGGSQKMGAKALGMLFC